MRGAVLYGPRDIRFEDRETPKIMKPTDAIIRISATCVCGSDLWPYRGIQPIAQPTPMGHEYCGIVEEVGSEVFSVKPGQFVIGSFFASDNTCPNCQIGYQSSCQHAEFVGGAQASLLRVPLADGTLVATPGVPSEDLIPSLLSLSDVMGTAWFAADAANVKPGSTVAVVGDGAVGLLGVLSAEQMGAERIIAMSRHESRQRLASEFGATDIVTERGDDGVARIKELTNGVGADAVLECVGTGEIKVQYFGYWVTGTFPVTLDSNKTLDIRANIYNITVTVRPANQEGVLQSVNVTAYNSTQYGSSSKIATGITDANGRVSFQDVPNGTMFFASYATLDYSILISESSQTVSSNGQSISFIADQNAGTTTLPWEVFFIASFVLAPKPTTPDIAAKRKTET